MRIIWINPAGSPGERFHDYLKQNCDDDVTVSLKNFEHGPRQIESLYSEALVVPHVIHEVKKAEIDGFDGAVIGCFADPGLYECREVTEKMSVVGPMEASLVLAMTLGHRFSIVIGRKKWAPFMLNKLKSYGFDRRFASFRDVNLKVRDFVAEPEYASHRIFEAAQMAVQKDGAEVVVLGCTGTYGQHRAIQGRLGVPVIDPVLVALNHVSALVRVRQKFGWSHSKACSFQTPLAEEILGSGLSEIIGAVD